MAMDLWTPDELAPIAKLLFPRSIAIIGASERNRYGARFLDAALRSRGKMKVYPVNPNHAEMKGMPCYPSITDVPEPPDLVALLLPQNEVLNTLQACSEKGVGAAIVISGGFAERGTAAGRELQEAIGKLGRETGM